MLSNNSSPSLFGSDGLGLSNCALPECVRQSVIDAALGIIPVEPESGNSPSGGVIVGLAVAEMRATRIPRETRRLLVDDWVWSGGMWRMLYTGSGLSLLGQKKADGRTELGSTSMIELRKRDVPPAPARRVGKSPKPYTRFSLGW
ncbi:hypothetical protein FRC08_010209 [Ceratobasidium sp. 394]|nr:hypothetical protein FRC08_010209 [Ceratobasidium sp. 394]KAG9097668.1 hypothetical protein FS749_005771 [Ceratobasidium sp. UAMH 11750]